jgi:uncharacterized membrane protein
MVLLCCGLAYTILLRTILAVQGGRNARLAAAVGSNIKEKLSLAVYLAAIPLAFVHQAIADALYVMVLLIWLVPDPRIESRLRESTGPESMR